MKKTVWDNPKRVYEIPEFTVESDENQTAPPTWNDAINAMSAEEKAEWMLANAHKLHKAAMDYAWKYRKTGHITDYYKQWMTDYFNSPYGGGKAKEGAE